MTYDPYRIDDLVPDLSLDSAAESGIMFIDQSGELDTKHRKFIRGFGGLAWFVVISLTLYMMFNSFMMQRQQRQPDAELSPGELLQPVFMGKFALGMRELSKNQGAAQLKSQSSDFLETIDSGPIEQRFCHAVLLNELSGPEEALQALKDLRKKTRSVDVEYRENHVRAEAILTAIFEADLAGNAPDVSPDDREFLSRQLPWFGELALNTSQSGSERRTQLIERAEYSVILLSVGVIVGLGLLGIGMIIFLVFMARLLGGSLQNRVVDDSKYGPVYIETFAIWFVLFLGVSLAVAATGVASMGISTAALIMLLPLSALTWPVIRGIPFNDLLQDIGLQMKNPFVEVMAGVVAYLALLPLLVVGIVISAILLAIMSLFAAPITNEFAPQGVPHPIANEAFNGGIVQAMVTILFIAAVLAPLTEEIMFRGVLYRNLRDSSHRMARWASIIFAALFSSLVFAAIHPQGIVAIPVLTILAFGFCMVRQWRGSLIAPMTMHALHNTMATSFLIPLLM